MTTNNLTELWKKGELPRGEYYVENNDGVIGSLYNLDNNGWYNIKEVLAPVPSYEEWKELSKQRNQLIRDVKDLAYIQEENQKLKELLEECGIFLDVHRENDGNVFINDVGTSQIIDKINEALK